MYIVHFILWHTMYCNYLSHFVIRKSIFAKIRKRIIFMPTPVKTRSYKKMCPTGADHQFSRYTPVGSSAFSKYEDFPEHLSRPR